MNQNETKQLVNDLINSRVSFCTMTSKRRLTRSEVAEFRNHFDNYEVSDFEVTETLHVLNALVADDAGTWEDVRKDYFRYLETI